MQIKSYPKQSVTKLEGKAYTQFRILVYEEWGPYCCDCGNRVQLYEPGMDKWGRDVNVFNVFTCAHVAHQERRAKIGDDVNRCRIKCYKCHILKEHWGENG